jgi:Ni/Co efflux regulator RcnB
MYMKRILLCLACAALLCGCGLAGTATGTAAGSAAEVEQARQAKQMEDRARQQAEDAVRQDRAHREQAEKDAQ